MRPVTREKQPEGITKYKKMREKLLEHWGKYCSYCELPITNKPDAEHILPQKKNESEVDNWDNLHLSCGYCNGRKGDRGPTPETRDDYLWPTKDNTARAFQYPEACPKIADGLTTTHQAKAQRLLDLFKLDEKGDVREKERQKVYFKAIHWRVKLMTAREPELLRESVVDIAQGKGFFSIWMEVFSENAEMRWQLIAAFPGTAQDCFDADTKPVQRPDGRL